MNDLIRLNELKKRWHSHNVITGSLHLGDKVAAMSQPIAKAIDYVFNTNVAGCNGCAKRKAFLNKF